MGLNGVDNGRCWFDNYRVPRDALLDKFCTVNPAGEYASPIKDNTLRFATMISTYGKVNAHCMPFMGTT